MNLLSKLTTAKTSTLIVVAFILSAWWAAIPWISFAVGDLSNWLLSTAVSSGPYRLTDIELFKLLDDIYRAWWGVGVQFFCVLTVAQLLVITPLGFYLSHVLYMRYKAGTAKLWLFLVPVITVSITMMFTLVTLYLAYADVSSWWSGANEQAGDAVVMDSGGSLSALSFAEQLGTLLREDIGGSVDVATKGWGEVDANIHDSTKYPFLAGSTLRFKVEGSPEVLVKNLLDAIPVQFPDNVALEKRLLSVDMRFGNKVVFNFEE